MILPKEGEAVFVPEDGLVHRVARASGGEKADGTHYNFYAYWKACGDTGTHVAYEAEAPCATSAPLTCLACIATGSNGYGV